MLTTTGVDQQRGNVRHAPGLGLSRRTEGARNGHALAQFSHELRNCLGTVRQAVRVLENETVEVADRRRARTILGRQVDQMTRLVDDLMDSSLAAGGRLRLDCTHTDLRVPLARAIEAVEFQLQQRRQRLSVSNPFGPVLIHADAARLQQVFVNLLTNASKYTDAGGEVDVSVEVRGREVAVHVRDSGIGISPELLPRIFEPYVRSRRVAREDGVGLGLVLVRNLVEAHGGRVQAASEGQGRGSEFTVWLPRPKGAA